MRAASNRFDIQEVKMQNLNRRLAVNGLAHRPRHSLSTSTYDAMQTFAAHSLNVILDCRPEESVNNRFLRGVLSAMSAAATVRNDQNPQADETGFIIVR